MNEQDNYRFVLLRFRVTMEPILQTIFSLVLILLQYRLMAEDVSGFGTKGTGVYLISADNMTQLQHFTTTNSQLLSNNIQSISINDATGEVFFATDNGLSVPI